MLLSKPKVTIATAALILPGRPIKMVFNIGTYLLSMYATSTPPKKEKEEEGQVIEVVKR
jgi:hypothetical protein